MREHDHLTCPSCGQLSDRPLATFVAQPRWRCVCGFRVELPTSQVEAMLARIEKAKALVRFGDAAE